MERAGQPTPNDAEQATPSPSDLVFPDEPFACPSCGQMLGPDVRVCVACNRPVDVTQVRKPPAAVTLGLPHKLSSVPPVRFSWGTFLFVLGVWSLAAIAAQRFLGIVKGQWVMGGAVILSSAWVFYDAQERGVPRPLRWGLCSLLLWIVVFPWYLARRRTPEAPCPFVEAHVRPLTLALLLVLILFILLNAVLSIMSKAPS